MPPRTRNTRGDGAVGSPLALEDPARMPVAALQSELQRLGLEWRKDAAGNRLKKADLVARLAAARAAASPDGERGPKRPRGGFARGG